MYFTGRKQGLGCVSGNTIQWFPLWKSGFWRANAKNVTFRPIKMRRFGVKPLTEGGFTWLNQAKLVRNSIETRERAVSC